MNNVNKLEIRFVSKIAIPRGGGFKDGLKFLTDESIRRSVIQQAKEETAAAIKAVREAADPNPYRQYSDDEIAAVILEELESKEDTR